MLCPVCNGKTRVIDSRPSGSRVYRRRLCELGHRTTTHELSDESTL